RPSPAAARALPGAARDQRAPQSRRTDVVRPREDGLRDVFEPPPRRPARLLVRSAAGRPAGPGGGASGPVLRAAVRRPSRVARCLSGRARRLGGDRGVRHGGVPGGGAEAPRRAARRRAGVAAMTTTVLLGAIAPHSDLAIAEACSPETRDVTPQTQRAMDGFGRRVAAVRPDA